MARVVLVSHTDAVHRATVISYLRGALDVVVQQTTALEHAQPGPADLLILEYPDGDAGERTLASLERWRAAVGSRPVVLLAHGSTVPGVIRAFKCAIDDYLCEPVSPSALIGAVRRFLSGHGTAAESSMVGRSERMCATREEIRRAARSDANVLITGETGTGKELAAEAIHRESRRSGGPYICVNCAAIPDDLLESELFGHEKGAFTGAHGAREGKARLADGGTLFLDEVGELSPCAQAKILRMIDKREVWPLGGRYAYRVNSRIVAATNRDLEDRVRTHAFRADLFYRLNVARIHLPPLRDRVEDLPLLVDHYVRAVSARAPDDVEAFEPDALLAMAQYSWPGNVRELKNTIESLFVTPQPKRIGVEQLPARVREAADVQASGDRDRLIDALTATRWNVSEAARQLSWSRMTIYRKMMRYHVVRTDHADATGARDQRARTT